MPELPEVESFRKFIEKTSLQKKIEVIKLQAPKMLLDTNEKQLRKTLINNSFDATMRHGKFLFIKLKSKGFLMLHFGLTGDVEYMKAGEKPPVKFVLQMHFDDDSDLFFTDTRKMGKIALLQNVERFIEERGYGRDALEIRDQEFMDLVKKKRVAIKTVLMDQKIVAGIGNEFSDEILFQAKIHPASITAKLSEKQLKGVYQLMLSILKEAVKSKADRAKLEHYFFLDNRKAGLTCRRCQGETAFQTIGGRSSYFCPYCQKLY